MSSGGVSSKEVIFMESSAAAITLASISILKNCLHAEKFLSTSVEIFLRLMWFLSAYNVHLSEGALGL